MENNGPNTFFRPVHQAFFIFLIGVVVLSLALALYSARWILIAAAIGIGLGVLISPLMQYLRTRMRIPQGIGAFLFLIMYFAVLGGIGYLIFTLISQEFVPMLQQLPSTMQNAQREISAFLKEFPWLQSQFENIHWGGLFRATTKTLLSGLETGAVVASGFLFVLAISLYLAVNPMNYVAGVLSLFPAYLRQHVKDLLLESARTLRQWFLAQLIAMLTVGTLTAIGLLIIGLDYWLLFGVLTAALDIIPYLGPILAAFATSLVTLGSDPDKVIWVLVIYTITQQVEGDVIIPMIMKGRIRLPPIQLLTLMLVFGVWFGILGVFVAPPFFAVARTVYLNAYVPRMNRALKSPRKAESEEARKSA